MYSDDGTLKGSFIEAYITTFAKSIARANIMLLTGNLLKEMVEEAGFIDITVCLPSLPTSPALNIR